MTATPASTPQPPIARASFDARYKLLAALVLTFATAAVTTLPAAALALALAVLGAWASPVPVRTLLPALARLNLFSLFIFITVPLVWQGTQQTPPGILFTLGPLAYTQPGLLAALIIGCKGNAMVLFFLLLPGTSSLAANCAALLALGLPEKLITLLQLVARHIVSLRREYTALTTAAALRGFTPAMHPRAWKTTAYLAAMLFIRCFDTAKRTEKAMLLRGFCGKLPLFLPETPQPQARDKWLLGGSVLCALLLILTNALPPTPL